MYASILIGLTLVAAAPVKEAPKKEVSIHGTWTGEKAVAAGKNLPVPAGGIEFSFTSDGKFMVREGKRERPNGGSYKVDTKKTPHEIDLIPPPDNPSDQVMKGIFKVEGDRLTIAITRSAKGAGNRPEKFESPEGSEVMVLTFKRATKE